MVARQNRRAQSVPRSIVLSAQRVVHPSTMADSEKSGVATTPGSDVGVTIGTGQIFWLTDLTVTNTGTVAEEVTLTDGSGGTVKESVEAAAGTTVKVAYTTPKAFIASVYAYGSVGSISNVSVSGLLSKSV